MECAGKVSRTRCTGPPTRRCGRCGAVAYCSVSHQEKSRYTSRSILNDANVDINKHELFRLEVVLSVSFLLRGQLLFTFLQESTVSHWSIHKEECERLENQMKRADVLNEFPFTFSREATVQVYEKQDTRCSFMKKQGIHQVGMWMYECSCGPSVDLLDHSRIISCWNLSSILCPCKGPSFPMPNRLHSWKEYYEWRCIPLYSPVALLLHWPLTLYHAFQLAAARNLISDVCNELCIHYLGPDKELSQLAVFGELNALFPRLQVHVELVGPAVPQHRDGERIDLYGYAQCIDTECACKFSSENLSLHMGGKSSVVRLRLHSGYYHDRYTDIAKDSVPHLIIAPNAGVAAFLSWLPTIELIKAINVPAIFSDYCEEAAHLAVGCLSSVTSRPPTIPIRLNPFRQPMLVDNHALFLPCYSNCFLFGM